MVMRCMTELYVSVRRKAVDAYPGDFEVLVSVCNDLLNFRFFFCQLGMTKHTFSDGWNSGSSAIVGANMAVNTFHPKLHVSLVRECDRLLCHSRCGA